MSRLSGRVVWATGSCTYSWTTSAPARSPVLRTVSSMSAKPSVGISAGGGVPGSQAKEVYVSPWPKG